MNKGDAVFAYKTSLSIFKTWRESGLISPEELQQIDTMLAQKYGLSSCSIYRENDLLMQANRVIYSGTEGEAYEQNCNQN